MTKHFKISSVLFLLTLFATAKISAQTNFKADDLLGEWYVEGNIAITKFSVYNGKYVGTTSWMKEPNDANGKPKLDKNNPNKARQTKPLLGATICSDFVYDGGGVWIDGTIYDARSGKTYSCKITMKDKNTISVRGYVGISLLGASTVWKRKI
jgi:uncharacterized protein (DUF2147 family)